MTQISFRIYGGQFDRFAPEAAQSLIDKTFDAKIEQKTVGVGVVKSAKVVDDGRAIELTVKWP